MLKIADRWFEFRRVDSDVTHITEPHVHPFLRCNMWHIRGRDRDMLIDTGLGLTSLRDAAKKLFDKPLMAVATHSHFDHVGGLHEFDRRIIHSLEAQNLATAADTMALTSDQFGEAAMGLIREAGYELEDGPFLSAAPYEGFDIEAQTLTPTTATQEVSEGDLLDLGDRHVEVLHLPGHSPGSIGLYEHATQTLFSGDAIYDGPLLDNLPESDIGAYISTFRRLMDLPVSVVHAGHDTSFGRDRLKEIVRRYLDIWES